MSERKIIRTDTSGRDVTNLPGLWSEDDTITDLSQPFTVEWLCEIGGEVAKPTRNETVIGFWSQHAKDWILRYSTIDGWIFDRRKMTYFAPPITTRGDVLKWLDVLGIVPATTKGGDK